MEASSDSLLALYEVFLGAGGGAGGGEGVVVGFLMHYIFKIGEMVLVACLMKKIILSLLPQDQNPQMMGPPLKFP